MKEFTYTVKDPNGIHARPAGVLVKNAKQYVSSITVINGDKSCNMKALLKLMAMGIKQGDTITVQVEGDDEAECAEAVEKELQANF